LVSLDGKLPKSQRRKDDFYWAHNKPSSAAVNVLGLGEATENQAFGFAPAFNPTSDKNATPRMVAAPS